MIEFHDSESQGEVRVFEWQKLFLLSIIFSYAFIRFYCGDRKK